MCLFTKKCQIKHELDMLILENGNQKNLISEDLVQHLQLAATPHPDPYKLGCVQKGGPWLTISHRCAVNFAIGPFRDILVCDVTPLNCVDMLLRLLYQQA